MITIKSVYKVGHGPSSSHTVGPYRAASILRARFPKADRVEITLYGSLAFTGEGHGTANALRSVFPDALITSDPKKHHLPHPNTMLFVMYEGETEVYRNRVFSVGGGSILFEGEEPEDTEEIYEENCFTDILERCKHESISLTEYIYAREGESLRTYLKNIWEEMKREVEAGLKAEGFLPGDLNMQRKAKLLSEMSLPGETEDVRVERKIASYAYAVAEENAAQNIVVTAPTCGASGVIPAVFYYMYHDCNYKEEEIIDGLAVAGLLGNLIRRNASISGAECGCQAEIGSACSMAAGGLATLHKLSIDQIEYAAETAMEHNLGLTCDPIHGLVLIPCIERNAVAAMRAITSVNLSRFLSYTRKISFDEVILTMYKTGRDMDEKYRETSHGGLAAMYESRHKRRLFRKKKEI